MPDLTLATLLDPATLVEAAIQLLFEGAGGHENPTTVATFTQRENAELTSERVDVTFTRGPWTGRWGVDRGGVLRHACWQYTLQLDIWTKRRAEDQGRHAYLRGKLHEMLEAAVRDPDFLAHHTLVDLNEQGSTESVQAEDDMDCGALKFTGMVVIRSDALRSV